MNPIFKNLFSLNTLVYCISVWLVVLILRNIIEKIGTGINSFAKVSDPTKAKIMYVWTELVLPVLPLVIGGIGSLYFAWLFPVAFTTPESHKILFGIVCGSFSSIVYRSCKTYITTVLPTQLKNAVQIFLNTEIKGITGLDPVNPPAPPPVVAPALSAKTQTIPPTNVEKAANAANADPKPAPVPPTGTTPTGK
jgi:hypothetical protein